MLPVSSGGGDQKENTRALHQKIWLPADRAAIMHRTPGNPSRRHVTVILVVFWKGDDIILGLIGYFWDNFFLFQNDY